MLKHTMWMIGLALVLGCGDDDDAPEGGAGDVAEAGTGDTTEGGAGDAAEAGTGDTTEVGTGADAGADAGAGGNGEDAGGTVETTPDSDSCEGGGLEPGNHEITVQHGGTDFEVRLHIPPTYDGTQPTPLLLSWHGLNSNAQQQDEFSMMNDDADREGYIVAYPNSPTAAWNGGLCCDLTLRDDVGFARALVADLQAQTCVDEKRIYSTGMSNGGYMSHRLACDAADLFAAVGPVAGLNATFTCNPSRPISLIQFHGTGDGIVSYSQVPSTIAGWVSRNGCTDAAPAETYNEGAARCETYSECDEGVEVTLCTIEGMGHCWPGSEACPSGLGDTNTDIRANQVMLELFNRLPLP